MTKSPQSTLGVKVGLCLPRRTEAMRVAARPRVWSLRSTTNHSRCSWAVSTLSKVDFWSFAMRSVPAFASGKVDEEVDRLQEPRPEVKQDQGFSRLGRRAPPVT